MSLLYKEAPYIQYKASFKELPSGKIEISFSCDGGKHGAGEQIAEYTVSAPELLSALHMHDIWKQKLGIKKTANNDRLSTITNQMNEKQDLPNNYPKSY